MALPPLLRKLLDAVQSERRAALNGLRSDIQELILAIRDQQTADRQQREQCNKLESNLPERIIAAERKIAEYARREESSYRKIELSLESLLVLGTWLTFIAAFAYAGVAIYQWREMTKAANASASAASVATQALDENRRQFNETLIQVQAQTSAQGRAADAAQSAATTAGNALKASIESFRVDERAWVEIEPIKPTPISPPDERSPASFFCGIYPKNVGKTVARDIIVKAIEALRTAEFSPSEMQSAQSMLKAKRYTVAIGSGQTTQGVSDEFPSNPVPRVLSPNTVADAPFRVSCQATKDYPSGTHLYAFVVGRIDYCDAFGIRHWKTFCFYVANARGDVWNCQEGNEEDKNTEVEPTEHCAQ